MFVGFHGQRKSASPCVPRAAIRRGRHVPCPVHGDSRPKFRTSDCISDFFSKDLGFSTGCAAYWLHLSLTSRRSKHRCWNAVGLVRNWKVALDPTSSMVLATSVPSWSMTLPKLNRQTGVGWLASGFSAGGRRAPGGIDGRGSLGFCGLGIGVVKEDRGRSLTHVSLHVVGEHA